MGKFVCRVPGGKGKPLRKPDSASLSQVSVSSGKHLLLIFVAVCKEFSVCCLVNITVNPMQCVACVYAGVQSVSTSVQHAVTLSAGELPVEEILIQQVIESGEWNGRMDGWIDRPQTFLLISFSSLL